MERTEIQEHELNRVLLMYVGYYEDDENEKNYDGFNGTVFDADDSM